VEKSATETTSRSLAFAVLSRKARADLAEAKKPGRKGRLNENDIRNSARRRRRLRQHEISGYEVLCEMENEKDDFKRHSVQEMMIYESIQDYQSDPERKP
jgi:hypothetical protein